MAVRIRKKTSREEWLNWRRENVNASEAAALIGADKYRTKLQLYHEKRGAFAQEQTKAMARGLHMEAAILSMLQEERPDWKIEPCPHYYDDPDLRIGCSPDAFAWSPEWEGHANVQLKTVARPVFEQDWLDEDGAVTVPLYYQIQTVIEATQTGAALNFIVPYVVETFARDDKRDLYIEQVPIHQGAWNRIVQETKLFWHQFEQGIEPPIEPERDGDFIKRLYPTPDGRILDLTGNNELPGLCANYLALSTELSALNKPVREMEKTRKIFATQIQAKIGAASGAVLPGLEIEWKEMNRKACQYRQMSIREAR